MGAIPTSSVCTTVNTFLLLEDAKRFRELENLHETVCCRIVSNDSQVVPVIGSGNAKLVVVIVSEAPSWNPISDDPMDLFLWVLTLRCTAKMTAYLRARLETYSDLLHVQPMA